MDSKLFKATIAAVVLVIAAIFATIIGINYKKIGLGQNAVLEVQTSEAEESHAGAESETKEPEYGMVIDTTTTQTEYGIQIGNDLQAFERVDTFFDVREKNADTLLEDAAVRLSLMATSVEKDLRVYVINGIGEVVTGESFSVRVDGGDTYKDLDKDGMIYIGNMQPGEYVIRLQDIADYKVPSEPTTIKVREQVEYKIISDISYLIKSESEIEASVEDTEQRGAETDLDGGQQTLPDLYAQGEEIHKGIDVSKWNKQIDWQQVREAGVEFAIIRVGYRGSASGCLVEDPYFEKNIRGAKEAGIKVGVYFFTQAVTEVEAVEEASTVMSLCKEYELDYPVFIDTEGAGGNGRADRLDTVTRTKVCKAFCTTLENAGYRAGVYASRNWYKNNLNTAELEQHCIWLAEYRESPKYEGSYQLWQYTSKGSVAGINGNVDMNISYLLN